MKNLLAEAFSRFPDSRLTEGERSLTYTEFSALSADYAQKIKPSSCVLVFFPAPRIDAAAILLACLSVGAVAVLVPAVGFEGREKICARFPHSYLYDGVWHDCKNHAENYAGRYPSEARVILFTSGTTAESKGVILTERNLVSTVLAGNARFPVPYQSAVVSILPLYHAFGLNVGFLALLLRGCSFTFAAPADYIAAVQKTNPAYFFLTPELLALHNRFAALYGREFSFGKMAKYAFCGGNFLSAAEREAAEAHGITVFMSYGLTECSPSVSAESYDLQRPMSVGKPISCTSVAVEDGEIVVTGENVAYGYDGGAVFGDRFKTGDLGYTDEDGFLYLTGRAANRITFADGTKVCPEQVEEIINSIHGVRDSLVSREGERFAVKIYVSAEADTEIIEGEIRRLLPKEHTLAALSAVCEPFAVNASGKKIR